MRIALVGIFIILGACEISEQAFIERSRFQGIFSMPESVAIDEVGGYVYVSNVNEYAKDDNGFISRVSIDGSSSNLHWLEGLDSPTGLAIYGNSLFLADYDQLVEADIANATILNRYPTADTNPVLNDVAIAPDGGVFVSSSGSSTIYHLSEGSLEIWLRDVERLEFANGLSVNGTQVVHGGKSLTVFNRQTAKPLAQLSDVNSVLSDIDGITTDGCGGFFMTTVSSEQLWQVDAKGRVTASELGDVNGIDIHFKEGLLALPQVGNSLTVYQYKQQC